MPTKNGGRPKVKLPEGILVASETSTKWATKINTANKVLLPVAIAVDAARIGYSGYEDIKYSTSRNTVETGVNVASCWTGGFAGGFSGAAIGSAILPGIGTIIGGVVGSPAGGLSLSVASKKIVNLIGDATDYDIEETKCKLCHEIYRARKYRGELCCPKCFATLEV